MKSIRELVYEGKGMGEIVDLFRRDLIEYTLNLTGGNICEAARVLRTHHRNLRVHIKLLGVKCEFWREAGNVNTGKRGRWVRAVHGGNAGDGQGRSGPHPKDDKRHELGRTSPGRRSEHGGAGIHSEHTGRVEGRGKLYSNRQATVLAPGHKGQIAGLKLDIDIDTSGRGCDRYGS